MLQISENPNLKKLQKMQSYDPNIKNNLKFVLSAVYSRTSQTFLTFD